ncbi:hypothetical protein ERJ75_000817600 [Trypanosoma vivax]|nr:hypothetical protein ERJ75_000817600 [Trypanosoma vivax]
MGGMWQSPKLETDKTSSSTPPGKRQTLESWAAPRRHRRDTQNTEGNSSSHQRQQQDARSSKLPAPAGKGTATLEDVALREACSAFAFDAWLAKWTTREQSTQKSGAANKGAELPAPRSDESDNEATPSARTGKRQRLRGGYRTQSPRSRNSSVAAPRLLATTLGLLRAAA